jgi:hypothetical protein
MDTAASYFQPSRYHPTETIDFESNTAVVELNGRIWTTFFPGDQGPNGEVEEYLQYEFRGTQEYTIDLDTGLFFAFSYQGTYVDICAALAGEP